MKVLCIDIGNTLVKAQTFDHYKSISNILTCSSSNFSTIYNMLKDVDADAISLSTVKNLPNHFFSYLKSKTHNFFNLDENSQLNFETQYPLKSIGKDRLALISSIVNKNSTATLIISAGTCVTYDLINGDNIHLGGAISPGLKMRLASLHFYTDKLPLVDLNNIVNFFNLSTENSILSGVVNGVIAEISTFIKKAANDLGSIDIKITGGDAFFLEPYLIKQFPKLNKIDNSTLLGLYNLFLVNEK